MRVLFFVVQCEVAFLAERPRPATRYRARASDLRLMVLIVIQLSTQSGLRAGVRRDPAFMVTVGHAGRWFLRFLCRTFEACQPLYRGRASASAFGFSFHKLLRVRKDGTLGPLFINRSQVIPLRK